MKHTVRLGYGHFVRVDSYRRPPFYASWFKLPGLTWLSFVICLSIYIGYGISLSLIPLDPRPHKPAEEPARHFRSIGSNSPLASNR